jgi:hypothetical protein
LSGNVILRGAGLALHAERARGAAEAAYVAECLWCRAESGLVDYDVRPVAVWSIEHARRHGQDHGQFVVTTRQHWRVGRIPIPTATPTPAPEPVHSGPRPHARPREARQLPIVLAALAVAVLSGLCLLLGALPSGAMG